MVGLRTLNPCILGSIPSPATKMKIVRSILEAEMIAVFLGGEINSPRWKDKIGNILEENNIDRKVLIEPNIADKQENTQRKLVLKLFRGYGVKDGMLVDGDKIEKWQVVELSGEDLKKVKYIDYDYWNELSGNSRLVIDGAKNVSLGKEIFGVSNQQFWQVAELIKNGGEFPMLILLSQDGKLTLLEGHVRLTAYLLANDLPKSLKVIVGYRKTDDRSNKKTI